MKEKEQKPKRLEEVIRELDEVNYVSKLVSVKPDNRGDKEKDADKAVEAAQKDLRKYAHETAKKYVGGYDSSRNPEELDAEFVQQAVNTGQRIAKDNAERTFYDHLDDILSEIPESNLETLALTKDIQEKAKDDDVLRRYLSYKSLENLEEHYKKNEKPRNEEEEKMIKGLVVRGAIEAQEERVKDKSKTIRELSIGLTAMAAQSGHLKKDKEKEYAIKGIEAGIKEARESYEKTGNKLYDVVRKTLREMSKGTREDFERALGLVYGAYKGQIRKQDDGVIDEEMKKAA